MDVRIGHGAIPLISDDREGMDAQGCSELFLRHPAAQALVAQPAAKGQGRDQEVIGVAVWKGLF
ncbi:MAG: hypothetical protein A2X40_08550 [Elusimicrobia bacterium GWC2_65_9]|nr:MAG: hypothetical protein A2X37_01270 [Elusimicrobia bacterium GWA2_66_18]OGR75982.1 MAG: hypothetical protein A2X40_08550 [Elusimicrobia bacterium GWC2_65_9]